MRSWPRSRQEAVYRPAVRDELSEGGNGSVTCMLTHTHNQLWRACAGLQLLIHDLFNIWILYTKDKTFNVMTAEVKRFFCETVYLKKKLFLKDIVIL